MLARYHTADAYHGGRTVSQHLRDNSRIFVGNYRGRRPTQHGMIGRKRGIAVRLQKSSLAVCDCGAFTLKNQLEGLIDSVTIDQRFSGKQARFART